MKYILLLFLVLACCAEEDAVSESLANAGALLETKGRRAEAEQVLLRAITVDPNCGTALLSLGLIYERNGNLLDASRFYSMAEKNLTGVKKLAASHALVRVNPYSEKLTALLASYAGSVDRLIANRPEITVDATYTLAKLGLSLPSGRKFFRGEPMASVEFKESMGYEVGEMKKDCVTHVGHAMKYSNIPDELVGMQYTLIVPGSMSPLTAKFKSDGVLLIFANKSFRREDRQKLERLGTKVDLPDILGQSERYEVFSVRGRTGDSLSLIFYVLVAGTLEKAR